MNFSYYNVNFRKIGDGKLFYVSGEVTNGTSKSYNTAAFRIVLFDQSNHVVWSGSFKIRGLGPKRTKSFEIPMEGIDTTSLTKISRHDIYFESGY